MCSIFTSVMGEWDHIILQNQKGLFTTEFLRILSGLLGLSNLLDHRPFSLAHPSKSNTLFIYLEKAVPDRDSASPSQEAGSLFLQFYWKAAIPACLCVAYGHILSRIIAFQRYPHPESVIHAVHFQTKGTLWRW